ncbi:tRNA (adenosine(37)-N6)-threonylcarbamoyltransferase complex dimerization subunit type 1 TsaB [Microaerobacter geothermalis]|uniref:tRNA (adenosine(37)-N6)-threonylcarbamoyltransferase complex dimerization subunit type 1 TsaB n=1 Tax=Microaerobacter geothermalis TaxID=674972 RepID=UPI001F475865|nr:tRNA (adenosine(37)-N6)-threonylcarbamoyltransferase complex dimerization subunit type 1 TsaB [Microaerobacter geothermalis]MCF6093739.1 tRNA (adenosine(37)-N6)-threonylcarbamoyltransferase complex dimerization subunit type 1 TsaB [Microaerobacter geothermalis]
MKILAIDTSNVPLGVAITEGEKILGETIINTKRNHSVQLMPTVQRLMEDVSVTPKELGAIAVAQGPGSYTGVRIGVTTAKMMAWALEIPLIGISSLEILCHNVPMFSGYIVPIFDARRGKVYTGLYQNDSMGNIHLVKQDRIILLSDWLDELHDLEGPVVFLGLDLPLHKNLIQQKMNHRAIFLSSFYSVPRPSVLGKLAYSKGGDQGEDVYQFAPRYLQLAEVEMKWMERQG